MNNNHKELFDSKIKIILDVINLICGALLIDHKCCCYLLPNLFL